MRSLNIRRLMFAVAAVTFILTAVVTGSVWSYIAAVGMTVALMASLTERER